MYFKIYKIIPDDLKKKFNLLIVIIILASLLELFSFSLIIPAIGLLFGSQNFSNYLFYDKFHHLIIFNDLNIFIVFLFLIYFFKASFLSFSIFFQQKVIAEIQKKITNKLVFKTLDYSFSTFVKKNSSKKTINILDISVNYIYQCLAPLIALITEIVLVFFFIIFLLFINPIPFFVISTVIIFLIFIYFKSVNKKLLEWGKKKLTLSYERLRILKEAIDGIILIKLNNNIKIYFLEKLNFHNKEIIGLMRKLSTANNLVKVLLELFAVCFLLFLVFFFSNNQYSRIDIIVLLGLYSVAAFKIIPSANRVIVNLQTLKFGAMIIDTLLKEINQEDNQSEYFTEEEIVFKKNIRFDNVDYSYIDTKEVFKNTSFVINKNDFVGIIGSSGSGKSTLINLLCGLLYPSSGSIVVDNKSIKNNIHSWRKKIAYVPQKIFLIDDTVAANIALGVENYSLKRVNELIYDSNFSKFIEELSDGINTKIGEDGNKLSIGQKQRLNILRALYHDPEILIFDESSSALDQKNEEIFLNLLMAFKSKKTVIFITHKFKLLENFDKIYEIKDKQILQLK
jgi:ABC-type bacteriocin/lantibiotic exporter with double-glycine peptidase domain